MDLYDLNGNWIEEIHRIIDNDNFIGLNSKL